MKFWNRLVGRFRKGQIGRGQPFGDWISLLVGDPDVFCVVEVGTWKGLGSTRLIADAILGSHVRASNVKVAWSIEANAKIFDEAKRNLAARYGNPPVHLLCGRLVELDELDRANLTNEEKGWLMTDETNLKNVRSVVNQLPDTIDLLLLDGGEFSSWAEFKKLESRLSKWLLLDDTLVRKNRRVSKYLSESDGWKRVAAGEDRNGWEVWIRLQPKEF